MRRFRRPRARAGFTCPAPTHHGLCVLEIVAAQSLQLEISRPAVVR
jgi:hypothetical protein